jgi:peptidyl-dipeptidase Dcp
MSDVATNPLLTPWQGPFGLPPFTEVRPEHFAPAYEVALARHREEVEAIMASPAPATFEDTLLGLERAGALLERIDLVFQNLTSSETSEALQALQLELMPRLAAHWSAIQLDPRLFARVDAVYAGRDALDPISRRLVERVHLDLVRGGARLDDAGRARFAEISERMATLVTTFAQNILGDEAAWKLELSADDLAGLPDFVVAAARQAAADRGLDGWLISLSRSSVVPFLTYSARRDLRKIAWDAWKGRGEHEGPRDNRPLIREILALRIEAARLLGYSTYAEYSVSDAMAGEPAAVHALLDRVWGPACARANGEREALQAHAKALGYDHAIEPHDWYFFAEKVRQSAYDFDEAELKPYLQLEKMTEAMFWVANRLFGLRFVPQPDLVAYHPDVKVYEVVGAEGEHLGVFLADNFMRASKRSGAWMSNYRLQSSLDAEIRPVVVNNNNFAKGAPGAPTLLSFDDARTLFHEFGHGLHGLLSQVRYKRLSGTSVLKDFVELPSQIYENWVARPEVLERFAVHWQTGEPVPAELLGCLERARKFNQGFSTVEYTASALVDLAVHELQSADGFDPGAFEAAVLGRLGMPEGIQMRHRMPHFAHIFETDAYAAGYYVYLWAEVLDADGFQAFVEAGDVFDPTVAGRLRRSVYAAGNSEDPGAAFRALRGRDPDPTPMLARKGLLDGA